jgi:hypothetical protein
VSFGGRRRRGVSRHRDKVGPTISCASCGDAERDGLGDTAALMKQVVDKLNLDDMLAITAYVGSRALKVAVRWRASGNAAGHNEWTDRFSDTVVIRATLLPDDGTNFRHTGSVEA